MKLIAAIFAGVLALAAAPAAAAPSARDEAAIGLIETRLPTQLRRSEGPVVTTLAQRMAELNVPGVSIAFIEDGKVRWTRAYGVADASDRRPVTSDTLFQAASMSKPVAAAAALRLVDEGKLDLDEDVNRRLKAWKVAESPFTAVEKVTLRRLLSHTAGLTVSGFPGYAAGKPVPTLVEILKGRPPANTPAVVSFESPGQGFAYSGGGFQVAQLLMEEAAGQPFPKLGEHLVLKRAGMRRSTLVQPLPPTLRRTAASGHTFKGAVLPGVHHTYPEHAAASLWTTPSDYGRFLIALQNAYGGRGSALLRRQTAQTMMTEVASKYGLGIGVETHGGRPNIGHGGSNAGFQCLSFGYLDGSRQGVVIMTNSDAGGVLAGEIVRALAAAYEWPKPPPPAGAPQRRAPYAPAAAK